MPDAYTPPGSSTSYDVPADLDAVDVSVWFEDFADTVDAAIAVKLAAAPAKNTQTADFDFALTDAAGLLVVANQATALAGTLKQNSAMASSWPADSVIRFINRNDGVLTITAGSGVTIIGTPLTFAKGKGGALVWVAANTWVCVPFSSGSAPATVTGTTGSPTTTTPDGKTAYAFTGSGSFTTGTAGTVEALVIAGGGGGGAEGGGGAGGYIRTVLTLAASTTYTVTVGAGGAGSGTHGATGTDTICGPLVARGGGGGRFGLAGLTGGSGGGSGYAADPTAGGAAIGQQGKDGGSHTGVVSSGGGGGGAGAAGASGTAGATPGAGGAGLSDSITGTSVARAGGGGGASASAAATASDGGGAGSTTTGTAGTANTGGGGGAGWVTTGGNGGSGDVIILVG